MSPVARPSSSQNWVTPSYRKRRVSELPSLPTTTTMGDANNDQISSSDISSRNYIDPWDLENYAYMERHYTTDDYVTSTPALESSQSDFYYLPNYSDTYPANRNRPESIIMGDESIGLFAGVEEEDFYNERYHTYSKHTSPSPLMANCYQSYTDVAAASRFKPNFAHRSLASDSYETDTTIYSDDYRNSNPRLNYELYSPSVMLRRPPNPNESSDTSLVYVYEAGSRKRKMALPKGNFGFDGRSDLRGSYRSERQLSDDCYPTDLSDDMASHVDQSETVYNDVTQHSYDEEEEIYSSKPVPKFQLSKYGHLKIDYSFSWNSLNRYISTD